MELHGIYTLDVVNNVTIEIFSIQRSPFTKVQVSLLWGNLTRSKWSIYCLAYKKV